jgi:hypothetical protein
MMGISINEIPPTRADERLVGIDARMLLCGQPAYRPSDSLASTADMHVLDVIRILDSQAHATSLNTNHGDHDVIANYKSFSKITG